MKSLCKMKDILSMFHFLPSFSQAKVEKKRKVVKRKNNLRTNGRNKPGIFPKLVSKSMLEDFEFLFVSNRL